MSGLRPRLTFAATAIVAVVLALTGIALVGAQRRSLTAALDETLSQRAEQLGRDALSIGQNGVLDQVGDEDAFAQLIRADGSVRAATATAPPSTVGSGRLGTSTAFINGVHYRIMTVAAADGRALAASPLDDVNASVSTLTRGLLVLLPVVSALIGALTWLLVGRTLRPVEAIRQRVASIDDRALTDRVPVPSSHDEIERLAVTMNAMLDRLQQGASLRDQFVADASHELRRPLTRLRTELEVERAATSSAEARDLAARTLREVIGMQQLVEGLLLLARHDAGAVPAQGPVDLDDVARSVAAAARHDREQVHVAVHVQPVQVTGNPSALTRAIGNVADNACRHARSRVEIIVTEHDGYAAVRVCDDGPGIADEDRERIFDRFYRADSARPADGTGLGLAIARALIETHGGTIGVVPATEGTTIEIRLPSQ